MAWAQILLSTVVEIAAWHTGRVASRLPAVPLQALTRRLVLSALLPGASVRTTAVPPNRALATVEAPVFVAPVADVVSHASPEPPVHPPPRTEAQPVGTEGGVHFSSRGDSIH